MNREIISAGQFFLALLGLVAWFAAALFGVLPATVEVQAATAAGTANVKAPSPSGAGAACGFAVAGGLCFLGAALAPRREGGRPHADRTAAPDRERRGGPSEFSDPGGGRGG